MADASLVVNVCNDVLHPEKSEQYISNLKADQARIREQHEAQGERPLLPIEEARQKAPVIDWKKQEIAEPITDNSAPTYSIHPLRRFCSFLIGLLFLGMGIKGTYPQIFERKTPEKKRKNFLIRHRSFFRKSLSKNSLSARQWWDYGPHMHWG